MVYNTYCFENKTDWSVVKEESLSFSNWDSKIHYNTFFKMCFVKNKGVFLKMRTDESDLRCENHNRDENIWEDSCMEFFFCPFEHRKEYLNFEMNPNGAYLCQIGEGKFDRRFVADFSDAEAEIKTEIFEGGWALELFVPCDFISKAYGERFDASPCKIKGNFYKCGDLTDLPHYDSYAKMGQLPPGFHNPDCFAKININER